MTLFQEEALRRASGNLTSRPDPLLAAIIDNFPGGICIFDDEMRMVMCNERLKRMLDYSPDLFDFGMPTLEQIYRYNALRGEYGEGDVEKHVMRRMELARSRVPHVYERTRPNGMIVQVRGVPLDEGGFLTLYFDVTAERSAKPGEILKKPAIEVMAGSNPLLEKLDVAISRLRQGRVLAVHVLDINKFGVMNFEYGREACDALLASVAERLALTVRESDAVARIGGDRFAVLQANVTKPSDVIALERRLLEAVRKPHKIGALEIPLSVSCGIALAPRDGLVPEHLLAHAEEMMLRAKLRKPSLLAELETSDE